MSYRAIYVIENAVMSTVRPLRSHLELQVEFILEQLVDEPSLPSPARAVIITRYLEKVAARWAGILSSIYIPALPAAVAAAAHRSLDLLISTNLTRQASSSFRRSIHLSPSRGPALTDSNGSFCTVVLVAASICTAQDSGSFRGDDQGRGLH